MLSDLEGVFLSACQTATGDKTLLDAAVHMPQECCLRVAEASLLQCGQSVSVSRPPVAKDVHGQLFRTNTTPDYWTPAGVPHNTVGYFRGAWSQRVIIGAVVVVVPVGLCSLVLTGVSRAG